MELDEESSEHFALSTPFRTYTFLRLPFGINIGLDPEIFQKSNEKFFGEIKNFLNIYFDELFIAAESESEHDKILDQVIDRARKLNVKFNERKAQYQFKEVKYLGNNFSSKGISVDPARIEALNAIKSPNNIKALHYKLGYVNDLRNFISNLANLNWAIVELLKKGVDFVWMGIHEKALNKNKEIVSKPPVLSNFDYRLPITL